MESSSFIRGKLVNYTTADCSDERVEDNRYIYTLKFEEDIGWQWVYSQVRKLNTELEADLEMWKIRPSGLEAFELEVREIEQRAEIDDNQHSLKSFES